MYCRNQELLQYNHFLLLQQFQSDVPQFLAFALCETMPDIYTALIAGSNFDCGNGIEFHFGFENDFSGFFDTENANVEGYYYEVLSEGKSVKLRILNTDKTKYVEYDMEFNSDGNILLTYPGMEQSILLAY